MIVPGAFEGEPGAAGLAVTFATVVRGEEVLEVEERVGGQGGGWTVEEVDV